MIKFITLGILFLLIGCTVSVVNSQGKASDVIDATTSPETEVKLPTFPM